MRGTLVVKGLIAKVNVPTDLRLFYGTLKPLQARKTKKKYGGGLPAYQKCRSLWLTEQKRLSVEIVYNAYTKQKKPIQ